MSDHGVTARQEPTRCTWCGEDELYVAYHDLDWGVPKHDDATLFELLTLEGAQAGLSWLSVLRRREGYRRVFEGFDPLKVAQFSDARLAAITEDPGVIRHRQKIASVITNARAIVALRLEGEYSSFAHYAWSLSNPRIEGVSNALEMSKRLRRDGFTFVGPTISLSFLQASGMRNDHARECFRYDEIEALRARART